MSECWSVMIRNKTTGGAVGELNKAGFLPGFPVRRLCFAGQGRADSSRPVSIVPINVTVIATRYISHLLSSVTILVLR